MDIEQMAILFEGLSDECGRFDLVENKTSNRRDLHAFVLLDGLIPDKRTIVSTIGEYEIYLGVEPGYLAKVITEAQILELVRCGVVYNEIYDSLTMSV